MYAGGGDCFLSTSQLEKELGHTYLNDCSSVPFMSCEINAIQNPPYPDPVILHGTPYLSAILFFRAVKA